MISTQYTSLLADEAKIKQLVQNVLETGHVGLDNFLDEATFSKLQNLMEDRTNCGKKGEQLKGTIAYDIVMSDEIFNFCDKVKKARCEIGGNEYIPLKREKQLVGFPYKDARDGKKTIETPYHFDGAYINIIVPIVLPENTGIPEGNVRVFPNTRLKYPSLVSKVISRFLRHLKWFRELYGYKEIQYKIGTFHIFFGDLSFHGVEPITHGERIVMTINSHW